MSHTLSSRALLVGVEIKAWQARKLDKAETAAVAAKHGIATNTARVHKALLPESPQLVAVQKQTGVIRTLHYARTLAWGNDLRILRTEGFQEFSDDLNREMVTWRQDVTKFVDAYPALQQQAQQTLNGLYNDADYPDVDAVRDRFAVDVRFYPVPTANDWRVDLDESLVADLRESIERQVQRSQAEAMKDVWGRVRACVENARERLSQPDAIFRDSLVENARELVRVLPSLNIADDPVLERVRLTLDAALCTFEPETLRKDLQIRGKVANAMDAIMSKMGGMYA